MNATLKSLVGGLCVCAALAGCSPAQQEAPAQEPLPSRSDIVIENIMARRSIRQYKPQPVNRDTLQRILECGIHAPNGMHRESWQVRVTDNADFINGLTELYKKENPKAAERPGFRNMFNNAPTVVFIA